MIHIFETWNTADTVGAMIIAVSVLLMLWRLLVFFGFRTKASKIIPSESSGNCQQCRGCGQGGGCH